PPIAKPILVGQLSQESAGLTGYLFLFNRLYIEGGAYWSAQTSFTNATTGGPGPLDSTAPLMRISGSAPYWRLAWEQDWGYHALSFGTYGIWAPTHPTGVGNSGPLNTFTDIAVDAQYQYITDDHLFSVYGTWINEHRHFNNHNLVDHTNNWLNFGNLAASYFFRRKVGGYVQAFSTTGTADSTLYASGTQVLGSANGKPNTQGYLFEVNFLPWLNTKLGLQYTMYTRFNGRADNYDGFSRNAWNNNTVYLYVWTAFYGRPMVTLGDEEGSIRARECLMKASNLAVRHLIMLAVAVAILAPRPSLAVGCADWVQTSVHTTGTYVPVEQAYARPFAFGLSFDCNGSPVTLTVQRAMGGLPICEARQSVEVVGTLSVSSKLMGSVYQIIDPTSVKCLTTARSGPSAAEQPVTAPP